jgi:uncharacterized protein YbaR (Trm112 family)
MPVSTNPRDDELCPEVLALLRCPACDERPPVRLSDNRDALVCDHCRRVYPIVDDLPRLIVEDAGPPTPLAS